METICSDFHRNPQNTINLDSTECSLFKVAYYSFIRVQEVYTTNVQINLYFCFNILITNKNPYMRQLLLQITVWEVKGARNGKTVHDQGAWERTGKVCFTGN